MHRPHARRSRRGRLPGGRRRRRPRRGRRGSDRRRGRRRACGRRVDRRPRAGRAARSDQLSHPRPDGRPARARRGPAHRGVVQRRRLAGGVQPHRAGRHPRRAARLRGDDPGRRHLLRRPLLRHGRGRRGGRRVRHARPAGGGVLLLPGPSGAGEVPGVRAAPPGHGRRAHHHRARPARPLHGERRRPRRHRRPGPRARPARPSARRREPRPDRGVPRPARRHPRRGAAPHRHPGHRRAHRPRHRHRRERPAAARPRAGADGGGDRAPRLP